VGELAELHGGGLRIDRSVGSKVRYVVRLPRRPAAQHGAETGASDSALRDAGGPSPTGPEHGPLALSRRALSRHEEAPEPAASPAEAAEDDRTTVLVIDDNSVICTLVRAHLEPEYRVREAHDGAEGYALARSLLPDLVITDVMMPELDGFELCRKIKEDPDIDHVPVVFLTARADIEDKVEGLDVGADAYLTKPFEPEELIARTENLIATRQTLRQSFRGAGARPNDPEDGHAVEEGGVENAKEALPSTAEEASLRDRVEEAIAEHLTDPDFGVAELATATALSTSQLRRRMKEAYDRTPVQLIRCRRLEAGAQLLEEREDVTIGEVAYAVGFNSQSYFSRSFRDEFGVPPSEYRSEGVAA
jgi:DNA-binding response OmpR family regulator